MGTVELYVLVVRVDLCSKSTIKDRKVKQRQSDHLCVFG